MTSPTTWRWLLALVAGVAPAAMAQICTPDDGSWGLAYIVRNQSDLDVITASCTTVNGSLIMGANYAGPFSLPNVRNITSLFRYEALNEPPYKPDPTSVDLPDLEFLGDGVWFSGLSTLTNFSAPNLKLVGRDVRLSSVQSVNLRSLEEAESLEIVGNISRLQLDSLQHISKRFVICDRDKCDEMKIPITSLDLFLPSLHTVGSISITGRLSNLGVPNLSNITGAGIYSNAFELIVSGETINVSFPELIFVGKDMELLGDITSLLMPKMKTINQRLGVRSHVPLDINLPLERADDIGLSGNISSVQFPNLKFLNYLSISSDLSIDCGSIKATISEKINMGEETIYCKSSGSNSAYGLIVNAKTKMWVVGAVVGLLSIL